MSRRKPRREYYEEDEIYGMDREPEGYDRPLRQPRYNEIDEEYFRRRSEPLVDDMERMHICGRPRRDFMERRRGIELREPRGGDLTLRRSREELESDSELDLPGVMPLDREAFERKPWSWSRRHLREVEDPVVEWQEGRRGPRRHPMDVEEGYARDDMGDYHGSRRRLLEREREFDDGLIIDERERRPDRRHRPRRITEEDLLVERERERDDYRRRHSEPQFENDPFLVEERYRSGRRRRRELEDDDIIFEDKEPRSPSRRRPERRSEDDILFEKREKRRHRRRPEREMDDESVFKRKEKEDRPLRRGWDSEVDMRSRERRLKFGEEEEVYHRRRQRSPPPRRVEVEEVLDDVIPERHRGPIDRSKRDLDEEEKVIRRKDKGLRPVDPAEEEEEIILRERRERRRSVPPEDLELESRGRRRGVREDSSPDADIRLRSRSRVRSSARDPDDIVKGISIRKSKEKLPSRPPSPSLASIHVPPIHQDVFTHHRHIDHGFEGPPPHVPSQVPSPVGSDEEIDIKHLKMRGGRIPEEKITLRTHDSTDTIAPEDSISPTSGPGIDFSDPWEREATSASRSRHIPLDKEKDLPSMTELETEMILESAAAADNAPRSADDWSVVHAPSKEEAIEMSGGLDDLDVIEVKPRRASVEEVNLGRVAQQVTETRETRDYRWTEIAKKLVVREAIEQMDYEYEESNGFYYIFSYLTPGELDDLVELSDEIRSARRRRIHAIQRERASISLPSASHIKSPPVGMPARARMAEKRMQEIRDREWMMNRR
ncbi:hypothetical protein N7535_002663 [Penicillium sp. DV-2018c]|nr:hypothetical protein N7461_001652 [Penicillium sp. DV-2018c]KAJ5575737.1 hypothetical protein N7535_002663 [Penicillium sp. DV-2018c]